MDMVYSVVGLGKLGASLAAAIASRGFEVIGVDINRQCVDFINASRAPIKETNLNETIVANRERLRATMSYNEAVLNSDVTFVVVPTPSDERGVFSLKYAASAFREIGRALSEKREYHNVVLSSTVLPGATRYGLLPFLEQESGKTCGRDFGLCYNPEFVALGSVIQDLLNPDFTLIGEFDEDSGSQLEACLTKIMKNNPPCRRMSLENAELTKIAVNTFVTTKITFANMLADLCERIPGGNVDVVSDTLGLDQRIGKKYLTGALGYGGPCFPRDNVALSFFARTLGLQAGLAETTDSANRAFSKKVVERLRKIVRSGTTVAVLGLAYKPFSNVIEESQGVYLAREMVRVGAQVIAYDPLANEEARSEFGDSILIMDSVEDCLMKADIVLITTADPVFQRLTSSDFENRKSPVTVVDFWRILDKELSNIKQVHYVPIGRSLDEDANKARLAALWNGMASRGD